MVGTGEEGAILNAKRKLRAFATVRVHHKSLGGASVLGIEGMFWSTYYGYFMSGKRWYDDYAKKLRL